MDQFAVPAVEAGNGLPGRSRNLAPSVVQKTTSGQPGGRSPQRSATPPPADGAGGSGWRDHLHRLDGLGLVLLPIGAGSDRKGPVDPRTGNGLKRWQQHPGFTAAEIGAMNPEHVIGAGLHTGPSNVDVLDLDGLDAVHWVAAHDVDPRDPALFRITRTTDPDRFKIPFRLTPEQRERLPKSKLLLRVGEQAGSGKGHAVELYGNTGAQVVALGHHAKSGGWYDWAGEPSMIGPPSEAWMQVLISLHGEVQRLRGLGDTSRPPRARSGKGGGKWQGSSRRHPCPVCGRDHSAACTRTTGDNGRLLVSCYHGGAFSAPQGLKAGDVVTGHDGGRWAFLEEYPAECLGIKSLFIDHRDREPDQPTMAPRPQQQQAAAQGEEEQQEDPPEGKRKKEKNDPAKEKTPRLRPDQVRDQLPKKLGAIRLNVRTGYVEAGGKEYSGELLDHLYMELSTDKATWGKEVTADAARYWAHKDQFDPVRNFLEALADPLPLDQWDQLEEHALGITDPLSGTILRRWLIAAVARVMEPGCWFRTSPVLIGGQEKGKTEWIRTLAGDDWFLSGVGKLDRDAMQRLRRAWVVELGELDGITRKADQEHLKSFLTERVDTYRAPYARSDESHPRRCVFIGTANGAPLRDPTGSTRFAVINTGSSPLPVAWVKEHRAALWARAVEQYRAGVPWTHTEEERQEIAERNLGHTVMDPWHDLIADPLAKRVKPLPMKTAEVYEWLNLTAAQQNHQTAERVGRILQSLGWEKARRRENGEDPKLGWWPCTPCTGGVHGGVHGQSPGPDSDLPAPCTPCTPIPSKDGKQGEEGEEPGQGAPAPPPAAAETQECGRLGVHGVHTPSDPSQGNGSAVHPRGARGVHGVHGPNRWRQAGPVVATRKGWTVTLQNDSTGEIEECAFSKDGLAAYGLTVGEITTDEVAA